MVRILTNHVGYEASGPKHAVILGAATDRVSACAIKDAATGEDILSVIPVEIGPGREVEGLALLDPRFRRGDTGGGLRLRVLDEPRDGPLLSVLRPEERPRRKHRLERGLLLQGPAVVRPARQGGPQPGLPGRRPGRHGPPRRLVRRDGRLRQAPLPPVVFDVLQPAADPPHGVQSLQGPRGPRREKDPTFRQYEAPPRRSDLRRGLPRAGARPEGSFYRSVSGPGPEKKAEDRRIGKEQRTSRSRRRPGTRARTREELGATDTLYEVGYRVGRRRRHRRPGHGQHSRGVGGLHEGRLSQGRQGRVCLSREA